MTPQVHLPQLREQLLAAASARAFEHDELAAAQRGRLASRPLLALVAAAAVVAVVAFGVLQGAGHQADARTIRAGGLVLNSRFSIFNDPPSADIGAFAGANAVMDPMADGQPVPIQPDSVHQLASNIWLGATASKVCLSTVADPGSAVRRSICASPAEILDHGLMGWGNSSPTGPGAVVYGLVPDGVRSVVVHLKSGAEVVSPVERNGFVLRVGGEPASATYRDAQDVGHWAPL